MAFSETHQWGESLRKNLLRTLARNLSQLLSTIDVGTPLNRSASIPDYRLQVSIDQFEMDNSGKVRLAAHWQLSDSEEPQPLGIHQAELEHPKVIDSGDYDAMVSAMKTLYGQLAGIISETIVSQEN